MAWIYLIIAGIFETVWAVSLKYCNGFRINIASTSVLIAMTCSIVFLTLAMKQIPIGTAYAAWTGIGIVGVAIYGMMVLQESSSPVRIFCLCLILIGIIGLKLSTK
jgi:quaternary ammonium compound-resistance protein SugE